MITTEDFVGFNVILPDAIPIPLKSNIKVNIVDWRSPFEFYVQLKSMESKCDEMMKQIQRYYKNRATIQTKVPVGALILVRHKVDDVIKRGKVIEYNEQRDKYRMQCIDFGVKCICQTSDMYEMEKSFTLLPAMAMRCTFGKNYILNKTIRDIHDKVYRLIENANEIECEVTDQEQNNHTVHLIVKGKDGDVSLCNRLIDEKFLTTLSSGKYCCEIDK